MKPEQARFDQPVVGCWLGYQRPYNPDEWDVQWSGAIQAAREREEMRDAPPLPHALAWVRHYPTGK
jgi:hypothetical protein